MTWMISLAIMLCILLVAGVFAMAVNGRQQQRARALSVITRDKSGATREDNKDKQLARQRADIARKLKDAGKEQEKKKDKETLRDMMQQAGIEAPVSRFWVWSAVFAVVVWFFLNFVMSFGGLTVGLLTFTAFFGMPRYFLRWKARRRQKQFLLEMPDALDACVRLLQSGMPMTEAIAMASREYTGPLKEEMLRIYDNQRVGVPLGEAAQMTAKRIPLPEVHMFATALQIQSETGSSLSEVLTNLSGVIRARYRLRRKIQALSSEAKSSAAIIGALPPLVSLGLYCASPKYIDPLLFTARGHFLLGCCALWMFCGIMVMKQMINFRI